MSPEKEILDPYGEPDDFAARELARVRNETKGTGRSILRMALVIVVALGIGFFFVRFQKTDADTHLAATARQDESEPPAVHVIKVERAEATQMLQLPGETAAWDESTIYARVNGYVAKWFVDIGDHVTAGQVLASIDTPELDAELPAAKAKLNAAIAEVAVRQAQADFAQTTDQRWRDSPKGVVSDQEREAKTAGKSEAFANLAAAKAQVQVQQADVDRLTVLTQFKDVRAPFEGVIIQRSIDIGDLVTAGSAASTSSLYRLARDFPMRIYVHAPPDRRRGQRGNHQFGRSGPRSARQGHAHREVRRSGFAHDAGGNRRSRSSPRALSGHVCASEIQTDRIPGVLGSRRGAVVSHRRTAGGRRG